MEFLGPLLIRTMLEVHHRTYGQDHQEEAQSMGEQSGQVRRVDAVDEIRKKSLARVRVVSGAPGVSVLRPEGADSRLTARKHSAAPARTAVVRLPLVGAYHECAVACQDPVQMRWTMVMEMTG